MSFLTKITDEEETKIQHLSPDAPMPPMGNSASANKRKKPQVIKTSPELEVQTITKKQPPQSAETATKPEQVDKMATQQNGQRQSEADAEKVQATTIIFHQFAPPEHNHEPHNEQRPIPWHERLFRTLWCGRFFCVSPK